MSDNPVRDAEEHSLRGLDRPCIHCDICGGSIYQADDMHEGNDYYELDNMSICEDCIDKYLREHRKENT